MMVIKNEQRGVARKRFAVGAGGVVAFLVPVYVQAHCPLCTAGAGLLAGVSSYLGIATAVVGVLVGAFSLALGYWIARMIRHTYFSYQDTVVILATFFLTVLPVAPLIREYKPLYVALVGDYGTLLHTTYTMDLFIVGAVIGAGVIWAVPYISKGLTRITGTTIPFQGMTLTLILLVIVSLLVQVFI